MQHFKVLRNGISQAIDQEARKQAKPADEIGLLLGRLRVLAELDRDIPLAKHEVMTELRKRRVVLSVIAEHADSTVSAVSGQLRAEPQPRKRSTVTDGPGISITEAEQETGFYRGDIYKRIKAAPNADWFERLPDKRGVRILDIDGLVKAMSSDSAGVPGLKISEVTKKAGMSRAEIQGAIDRNPEATWFERTSVPGRVHPVVRILDVNGLKAARNEPEK